jgi:DNA integrity scanning protein DisA with diadenylate cyclase activity/mannitol/fructose-specific phosphotransferase system IIA component (Ntr-type)
MRFDNLLARNRVIDIKSTDLRGALRELLEACHFHKDDNVNRQKLLDELLEREKTMTTYLGNGVALPHLRVKMKRSYMLAVGRCPNGLNSEGPNDYGQVRHLFLLLASENAREYLSILASLARVFQDRELMDRLAALDDTQDYGAELKRILAGDSGKPEQRAGKFNKLILREAEMVARGARCAAIFVFGDTFAGGVEIGMAFRGFKTVLVTQGGSDSAADKKNVDSVLPVRSFSTTRLSQMRSAILIALTRNVINATSRVCCIGGIPQSNQFDTIVVVDIEREFRNLLMMDGDVLPGGVRPEVLERVIAIATELSIEGREGKPLGSLFVLGDTKNVKQYAKPLVMNPFYGYKDEDRNILNPFMDETVKELSSIDGAFLIRGDGVLESAGTLIHAPDYKHNLPGGLGSRHAAGAAITAATESLAIVVSSSTGQVTLFRRGEMISLVDKAQHRSF